MSSEKASDKVAEALDQGKHDDESESVLLQVRNLRKAGEGGSGHD